MLETSVDRLNESHITFVLLCADFFTISGIEAKAHMPSRIVLPELESILLNNESYYWREDKRSEQRLLEHDYSTEGIDPWCRILQDKDYHRLRPYTRHVRLSLTFDDV